MLSLLRLAIMGVLLAPTLAPAAALDIPGNGASYSGIGVITGWKCQTSGKLTVRFNGGASLPLAYGNERADVANVGACAHAAVGFVAIWNWANLGDGTHTAVVYDNGVEFARSTFTVTTLGQEYVQDATPECTLPDFPAPGEEALFIWNTSTQHLELTEFRPAFWCLVEHPGYWYHHDHNCATPAAIIGGLSGRAFGSDLSLPSRTEDCTEAVDLYNAELSDFFGEAVVVVTLHKQYRDLQSCLVELESHCEWEEWEGDYYCHLEHKTDHPH